MPARRAVLLLPLLLPVLVGACAVQPHPDYGTTLPASAQGGLMDPTRAAILNAAHVFGQPGSVAGNPAAAAEALGQLEYLAAEFATGPLRQAGSDALAGVMLGQGQAEARQAMGLRPDLRAQAAVDAWYGAAAALRAGDATAAEAALRPVAPDPARTLAQLSALPMLPQAAAATRQAQIGLLPRQDPFGFGAARRVIGR
jgi:hypothetical protein